MNTRVARHVVGAIAIALLLAVILAPYFSAATLIGRAAGVSGAPGTIAAWTAHRVSSTVERLPIEAGAIRTRVYRPVSPTTRAVLVVGGIHPDGIDEPRLMRLARELAATGTVVVTPDIPDLNEYKVTARVTDAIEDVAQWMTARPDTFDDGRIGIIGASFSGGLSVIAAGRASIRDRVKYVVSLGGHGNLPRVLRYLCTGEGGSRPPHPYGQAVVLYQAAELLVAAEQVSALRDGVELFLEASALNRTDRQAAKRLFAELHSRPAHMADPSATLLKHLADGDVTALGLKLTPYISQLGNDPSLSPDRSPPPIAPVYLLHGADDNVIPTDESVRLAEHLRGKTRVRLLISGFLRHADVAADPSPKDIWQIISFWKALMDEP